mmetsp:Transcript_18544/g.44319  ORF Transcript_18544/g.44319 Transcript_18544/m.44319 type:complete len:204 (+) Transcript_18544:496-1107(+)
MRGPARRHLSAHLREGGRVSRARGAMPSVQTDLSSCQKCALLLPRNGSMDARSSLLRAASPRSRRSRYSRRSRPLLSPARLSPLEGEGGRPWLAHKPMKYMVRKDTSSSRSKAFSSRMIHSLSRCCRTVSSATGARGPAPSASPAAHMFSAYTRLLKSRARCTGVGGCGGACCKAQGSAAACPAAAVVSPRVPSLWQPRCTRQ